MNIQLIAKIGYSCREEGGSEQHHYRKFHQSEEGLRLKPGRHVTSQQRIRSRLALFSEESPGEEDPKSYFGDLIIIYHRAEPV